MARALILQNEYDNVQTTRKFNASIIYVCMMFVVLHENKNSLMCAIFDLNLMKLLRVRAKEPF